MNRTLGFVAFGAALCLLTGVAAADQFQISAYGGYQGASHSRVTVTDGTDFYTGWEGLSFTAPVYYGVRGTWWLDSVGLPNVGLSIDFSHTKVYSKAADRPADWTHFEFTDGLNLLTANVFYRYTDLGPFRPYVGVGAGISIPHVELFRAKGNTWNSQLGGPSAQATAGFDYMLTDNWSLFAEGKANYSMVDVSIDSGDRLKTNLVTLAVNVGVAFHF